MAHAPENSVEAFRRALDHGATGLESDVRLSRDGVAVLVHDAVVRAGLRRIKVADSSWDALARHEVIRLSDLYRELGSDYELSLDVEDVHAAHAALHLAHDVRAVSRLWVCSPDLDLLRALRAA